MKKSFTCGADPEMFFKDESGKLISAIPFIEGTKEKPQLLPCKEGGLQFDNVAGEFCMDPANSVEEFTSRIGKILVDIKTVMPKNLKIAMIPSGFFDEDQLQNPKAQEFGCSPDYDAWGKCQNPAPCPADQRFRSAGGHLHVGNKRGYIWLTNNFNKKIQMVRAMDVFHGIISTRLDNSEEAVARRQLYGKAGCHRPTDYGVEYRALSNYWLKSPNLVMLMYHLTEDALKATDSGVIIPLIEDIGRDEIQAIINEGKVSDAQRVIDTFLMEHLNRDSKHYLEMAMNDIDDYIFEKEWQEMK